MTSLAAVVARLDAEGVAHALIGAIALAMHGVNRSTLDLDLLVLDPRVLDESLWADLRAAGSAVEIHRGDGFDPLEGVVRFDADGPEPIDVVVGHSPRWQRGLLERAALRRVRARDAEVPLPEAADLVLSKLYAGSRRDLNDVAELLELPGGDDVAATVEERLVDLPARCRTLWERLRASG